MRTAIVDGSGLVVNVVEWDGISPWQPPDGFTARPHPDAAIGDSFVEGILVKQVAAKPEPPAAILRARELAEKQNLSSGELQEAVKILLSRLS